PQADRRFQEVAGEGCAPCLALPPSCACASRLKPISRRRPPISYLNTQLRLTVVPSSPSVACSHRPPPSPSTNALRPCRGLAVATRLEVSFPMILGNVRPSPRSYPWLEHG